MMVEEDKRGFIRKAKDNIKNRPLVYTSAALIAACTALTFVKDCGGGNGPGGRLPQPICEPVRGDGRCCESEMTPYMRNADFTVKMEGPSGNQRPVPNPLYDPESCHEGDNVCQNGTDRARIPAPNGFTITDLRAKFLDGRDVPFPLEDDNSRDCVMARVREQPCAPLEANRSNLLTRPRVFYPQGALRTLRDRTEAEFSKLWLHPESLGRGDNHTQVVDNYEELCIDPNMPVCNADIPIACYCPNHPDCAPRVDPCGDGVIDRRAGEVCDPAASPTGCTGGKRCAPGCRSCTSTATHSECRDNQCVSVPGAGRDRCSSNNDCAARPTHTTCQDNQCVTVAGPGNNECRTNTDCEPPPPPPPPTAQCTQDQLNRLKRPARDSLSSVLPELRTATSANSTESVSATVSVEVRQGSPRVTGVGLRASTSGGTGSFAAGRVDISSVSFQENVNCNGAFSLELSGG